MVEKLKKRPAFFTYLSDLLFPQAMSDQAISVVLAERVMGFCTWVDGTEGNWTSEYPIMVRDESGRFRRFRENLPAHTLYYKCGMRTYSKDIEAAFDLVERCRSKGVVVGVQPYQGTGYHATVYFGSMSSLTEDGPTPARAICNALARFCYGKDEIEDWRTSQDGSY